MELFSLVGLLAYCGISLVVGIRLLLLARRTREMPEFLIGIAFLMGGAVGYVLAVAATVLQESSPDLARTLFYLGMPLISLCAVCLYRFWQQVYHPTAGWARGVVAAAAVLLAGGLLAQWSTTEAGSLAAESPWYRLQLFVQSGAYAINFFENSRFYSALRRRIALGLADPNVVNRVLMWAISSAIVSAQYVYTLFVVFTALPGERAVANTAIVSGLGLAAGVTILLAFFPPRVYRNWISAATAPD